LLAVVSVTGCFVACGSSDHARSDQDGGAGGEGGSEAGAPTTSGGSNSSAGSQNSAGMSSNANAGQGGEAGAGAAATAGAGGEGGSSSGGAGGEGGAPTDGALPAACPGVIGDYTQVEGTAGDDIYMETDLVGKRLVFSREGVDTFEAGGDGGDCLVGGPGDDHFSSPSEMASYFVGGAGADTYHIDTQVNIVRIVDMEAADTIALSVNAFPFLFGDPGDTAQPGQVYALEGYSAGTASIPVGEGSAIVYDPTTGELWRDDDRATKGSSTGGEFQLGTILNHDGYQFSLDDFVLE
jgi:hypothetical protein